MTKLCTYCAKEIPQTSKICPYCNRPLMEKVLTYRVDEQKSKDISSNSKSTRDFSTNIYSVSDDALDRIFEKKLPERPITSPVPSQRNIHKSNSYKKKNKSNNTAVTVLIAIIIVLVIVLVVALLSTGASNLLSTTKNEEKPTTSAQTTMTQTATPTSTTEISTSTTQKPTFSASSTDLYGYLGVTFETVSNHFGEQVKDPTVDEFYGGNAYYFDGLTVTTVESGVIVSVTMDYSACSEVDKYRFKDLFHASSYDDVISIMGTPDNDQLGTTTEPCISYVLDIGSGQSIKFFFDDENHLKKFDLFYAD